VNPAERSAAITFSDRIRRSSGWIGVVLNLSLASTAAAEPPCPDDVTLRVAKVQGCVALDVASHATERPWKTRFRIRLEPFDRSIPDRSSGADAGGCFWIDDPSPGIYELRVRAPGMRDHVRQLEVVPEEPADRILVVELDATGRDPCRGSIRTAPADACPCSPESPAELERRSTLLRADVVRLPPDAFPEVPLPVRRTLDGMACRVPQTYIPGPPHNLISGRFLRTDELHWAALCSRNETTGLLLLAADGILVEEVAPFRSDAVHLQGIDIDGTPGFNWAIDAVGREYILEHHARYGGPESPPIDHDGINSAVVERASTVLYWHGGQWLELTGAD
jgi:hypothetical protein